MMRNRKRILTLLLVFLVLSSPVLTGFSGAAAAYESGEDSAEHGLVGEYYISSGRDRFDFKEKKATIIDPNIDFDDLTPVFSVLTGQEDYITVRWTGQIEPKYSEAYTFHMIGDNGFRLWIDDRLIIDHWVDDWEVPQQSDPIELTAGQKYSFKVEYFENWGGSNLHLSWSSASQEKEMIPPEAFYLPEGFVYDGPSSGSISEDGLTAEIRFPERLSPLPEDITDHLSLVVAGVKWPIASIRLQDGGAVMFLEFEYPVYKKDAPFALLLYDGEGGLRTAEGRLLSGFGGQIVNHSTFLIKTRWADNVLDAGIPLPEYPRPQMVRDKWLNLNGEWEFESAEDGDPLPTGRTLSETILVPFAVESQLSGIERLEDRVWYKRQFEIPRNWMKNNRILLHFGAVDYEATVYINGQEAGFHKGGFDAFSIDITDYLKPGENELIVHVYDPTDERKQVVGKQRLNPGGIWYTSVTGIWQTVWLEPVPQAHITELDMVPDIDEEVLKLTVHGENAEGLTVEATALKNGKRAGTATGTVGTEMRVPVPDPRLWSPEDPFLYDLEIKLKNGKKTVDIVDSYFGMREITAGKVDGILRPLLNGEFVFQMGPLDQGYWPDGLYTAPTDEALKFDLQVTKDLGFNMTRKHMKVEPERWFYWADKLGLLVWQDMPSQFGPADEASKAQFEQEFAEIIDQFENHPSIIVWTVFNEGWGQYDTERLTNWVKQRDPSRLANNASGWTDKGAGDMIDMHMYVGPGSPEPTDTRIAVLGEYGGLGLKVPGHEWSPKVFNYEMQNSKEQLTQRYLGLIEGIKRLKESPGLSAAVYTQITDVEVEINGLLSYDREVEKADFNRLRQAHKELIGNYDQSDLERVIDDIMAFLEEAETGDGPGQYPQEAVDQLTAAIREAQRLLRKGDVSAGEIEAAIAALRTALAEFKERVNDPIPQDAWIDQFDQETLGSHWTILNEDTSMGTRWSLTENPGHLRLKTLQGDAHSNSNSLKNIFVMDAPEGDFEITTQVTAPVRENYQQGGFLIWEDTDHYLKFAHVWDTTGSTGYSLETAKEENAVYTKATNMAPHPGSDTVYLKVRKVGDTYSTFYWNGVKWEEAADPISADLDDIKIALYGFSSTNGTHINVDFDYLTVEIIEADDVEEAKNNPHGSGAIAVSQAMFADGSGKETEAETDSVTIRGAGKDDGNDDEEFSVGDLAVAAYRYGKDASSPDWETAKAADVNGDGVINVRDLS